MARGSRGPLPADEPSGTIVFRVTDRRWPFLWADDTQPPGRWHGAGEGPCHYLSNTPDAAWAEYLRHAEVHEIEELDDIERSVWAIGIPPPVSEPALPERVVLGGPDSYPECQAEARRLRQDGATGLRAPSAALLAPGAPLHGVADGGQQIVGSVPAVTYAFFGDPTGILGLHVAVGRPEATIVDRVRHFPPR